MQKEYTAAALCAVGAEKVVSNEIRKMGLKMDEGGFGRVRFKAGLQGLYKTLMGLRTADRVLLEAAWFQAGDFDALFEGVRAVPWEEFIPSGMGLRVAKVRTNRSRLSAETSIQAVVHKAAAEKLCEKLKLARLPEGDDIAEIRVYIEKDRASILLDLSGDPLFKRGYRTDGGIAPLRETTAAAIILLSGWKRKFPLYDPFCGSGTIAAEAAMYAWDLAPGLRRPFALDKLLISDKVVEKQVREEFIGKADFTRLVRIAGSDADPRAVANAKANLERIRAPLQGSVVLPEFKALPMEQAAAPKFENDTDTGFIITNPPYGKRLGDAESAEKVYAEMGGLSERFRDWKLALITDHPGFESFFGRKADSCRDITNGAIHSYLYQYEKI
ncbi:THUMP domain-containing class I SAM-dependent RNA methyltransferase [Leadbettera azotonutricia]|uniref:Methyltransferase n=1 Tax=Leadbettera azotonutricia (strain ATCC BAA-888 / DSM 13862 / ZAS-9) TaxID=545695 RepID=F5YBB1_LEAAZ|nr:class I SAM-dependent RNA methyltransferase [Leadbettera azotonutricia]AEF81242.1 methyltransferase [Leadbettera azotonutricia ZAS-9]